MEEKASIHIAFAFDQNFLTPFYVLLTSFFHNNSDIETQFHIIATGLNEEEISKLESYIVSNNAKVRFYAIDATVLKDMVLPEKMHFSLATYYRLLFPALMSPDVKKLLYIDTDTIITGPIQSLFFTNIENYPVGATLDNKIEDRNDLGVKRGEYFNAGVLLINISEWKKQQITEKALKFIEECPEKIQFVDQDALNYVLNKNWIAIDNKFNVTFYDIPENIKKNRLQNFLEDKAIIHFTTQNKPWYRTCRNRLRFLYFHYLNQSPQKGKVKYFDKSLSSFFVYFKILAKEFLIDHLNFKR